ncbi:hypothetical protein [Rhodoferax aquaticus]|uniref:Uncharacterized protein n=1 Tax=Rhodoferax aquaticus TaxID=2527691 RepID=A0A515EKG5_9BURK|nr:hypothetical protein [Rhodoferax aquaticus]QDL53138.1 hypothetical protein EXZ61_02545 [Rhodoferax aquaticus]
MPKADNKTMPEETQGVATAQETPRLGELIHVQVADGLELINNETGKDFEAGVPTLQTVTVTTLRRLQDGDLVRV